MEGVPQRPEGARVGKTYKEIAPGHLDIQHPQDHVILEAGEKEVSGPSTPEAPDVEKKQELGQENPHKDESRDSRSEAADAHAPESHDNAGMHVTHHDDRAEEPRDTHKERIVRRTFRAEALAAPTIRRAYRRGTDYGGCLHGDSASERVCSFFRHLHCFLAQPLEYGG